MRGIVSCGGYVPRQRLDRAEIAELFGGRGARGQRAVASYDEDTTTMGAEAARLALASAPLTTQAIDVLSFSTAAPAYLDTTNAAAIHGALRLDASTVATDAIGSVRSGTGALRAALTGTGTTLIVTADERTGLPTSSEETASGDGASALIVGDDRDAPVLAELVAVGSRTGTFLDRWRIPGETRSRAWEERFGETQYVPLGEEAWNDAIKAAGLAASELDHVIVTGLHTRAVKGLTRRLGVTDDALVHDLADTVGNTGVAHPALLLIAALEEAQPDATIALVTLADGADVFVFRTTDTLARWEPTRPVRHHVDAGRPISYGTFLAWKGMVTPDPPNRPPPDRPSSSAAARQSDWKYGFVGSRDRGSGAVHLPPQRVSMAGGAVDDMEPAPMADVPGTVATFTVDRLVYSPSPPVVFAVIDFDDGGRFAVELTDVDSDEVEIGTRVEMTFRRLHTSPDGIHNYFWKGRPQPGPAADDRHSEEE